jgi:hypothetical protein
MFFFSSPDLGTDKVQPCPISGHFSRCIHNVEHGWWIRGHPLSLSLSGIFSVVNQLMAALSTALYLNRTLLFHTSEGYPWLFADVPGQRQIPLVSGVLGHSPKSPIS